jgi:hypothetical protein
MGSSTAPKNFPSSSAFGTSSGNAVTQAQPMATVPYAGTPDLSAYTTQQQTDPTAAAASPNFSAAGAGSMQSQLAKLRSTSMGGGGSMPFYGMM